MADAPIALGDSIAITNGITFTPDLSTFYASQWANETTSNGRPGIRILEYEYDKGVYQSVGIAPFCSGLGDYHPVFSPDGKILIFNSRRALPGRDSLHTKVHLWQVNRDNNQWGEPHYLESLNVPEESHHSYASITRDGTVYFNSDRPGGKGGMDFYVAKKVNGSYTEPINLDVLNTTESENDLTVDPDERFIIFNRYISKDQSIDLWISFKKESKWTPPQLLNKINEQNVWELTPTITPDGKYFLYERKGIVMVYTIEKLLNGL